MLYIVLFLAGFAACYVLVAYCFQRYNVILDKIDQKYEAMVNILSHWQKKN